jgi:ATP-binding cassette subfamily A (ABC1) protein 3
MRALLLAGLFLQTTTISMLTGMIETSAGRATLYGRDVQDEMDEIRTFMGVCPQHDVLFRCEGVHKRMSMVGECESRR